MRGCAPLPGPRSKLHAKVVSHSLVVHATGRQPEMPLLNKNAIFLWRGQKRRAWLWLSVVELPHFPFKIQKRFSQKSMFITLKKGENSIQFVLEAADVASALLL